MMRRFTVSWICERAGLAAFRSLEVAEEMHRECGGTGFYSNTGEPWDCTCSCHAKDPVASSFSDPPPASGG